MCANQRFNECKARLGIEWRGIDGASELGDAMIAMSVSERAREQKSDSSEGPAAAAVAGQSSRT